MNSILSLFLSIFFLLTEKERNDAILDMMNYMKLIMFVCLLLLCSQYFQEVPKKVKSFSGAVQNHRFLDRIPHLVSIYFTGTNPSHWTSEFAIWT